MKTSTYLTQTDVALHCTPEDLWVSKFGRVYDYTNLVRTAPSGQTEALVRAAGTDISSWFDPQTGDYPKVTDALETRFRLPYGLPMLHADNSTTKPWWKDDSYFIGLLGKQRPIELLNTLSLHRHQLMVCEEETLADISARYARFNSNVLGYRWRYQEQDLKMDKTLNDNGIPDERATYLRLGWPQDQWYVPCIVLVWKDQMV
ncbi:Cytochrome_b5-like Heme/Steroid binding domain-containing protein [Hexamita inflata]|uniref:Cytochrome b5 domain-containing protein 1 n=1 Tax=Hexamita inflata TaxID=28002 RepID=A0AA86QMQ0_9EUKA|nr:Cytochrome b5-like Heme/Steroid binding domain-containing protein [Hexamita inflata]CAI9961103.1 Cytochrome b5-like Heme/Steroid binding domain-containing protein [Hexamita inflata]